MAKRRQKPDRAEHLSYCAGAPFVGDGTQATSPCPFNDSLRISAERYACGHCSSHITPDQIYADKNGITEAGRRSITSAALAEAIREETAKKRRAGLLSPKKRVDNLPSLILNEMDEIMKDQEKPGVSTDSAETEPVAAKEPEQEISGNVAVPKKTIKKKKPRGRKRLPRGI